jgi:trans-aconitate methyltransferase
MLDVGSGDGVPARRLADRVGAGDLTLMDSSSEMCARCETIRNARTVRGDIAASAPRVSGQFDLVRASGTCSATSTVPPSAAGRSPTSRGYSRLTGC